MNQEKFKQDLDYFNKLIKEEAPISDYISFIPGICHVKLGNYLEAQRMFSNTISNSFNELALRIWASEPHQLINIFIISGEYHYYYKVMEWLEFIKTIKPAGSSPVAYYAYTIMELWQPQGKNLSEWINNIRSRAQFKMGKFMGDAIQSMVESNEDQFNSSMEDILKIHNGMAKHGIIRESPERYLCLTAMSLGLLAIRKNISLNIENEYFSPGYLMYLLSNS